MTSMIYPTTNPAMSETMVVARAEGPYIYDKQGKRYLEGMAGLWCTALGYGNEEIIEAAQRQMRELSFSHMFGGKTHSSAIELADKLAAMVPMQDGRVFLGNSGSDANDTLLKLIRYHAEASGQPNRIKVIAREQGYHGVTLASAALTAIPTNHAHFQLPFEALGVLRTGSANYYRGASEGESEAEFVTRRAQELEALILAEGPETIAAMIAEPVSGAGGVIVPPEGYFEAIQAVLDRYGIWLWDDEVICGFGRLGTDFGANKMSMRPQMMTLAKALSSAYVPVSAAIVQGDIADCINASATEVGVFGHGYTYSGHPLGCAVASKVIDIYVRDKIFDHAATVGDYLQARLREFADHPLVGEVSGVGMIGAVELVADKESKKPFDGMKVGQFCAKAAEDNGLVIRPLGGNRVAVCPPLIIETTHVDELIEKFGAALNLTLDWVAAEKLA
ncbi:MAG: aminotransferase class III-fold pyridoxal phosphate-dependent enzyme [Luminiphilus sp.]|nr:aminotransferase class III-fold pyridoxal phosphate-dependent enzyme [Luminiphilus sp.]RZO74014.1 MAG: aminotransferase class III-fold pyridoxal phosphate-dependent enzyme [Halieaceae bacterium]CAI8364465.1 MAG: putative aminotransferase [Halieaceae bacterium]